MTDTPRVWVGSLSAYNNGTLLGDWFDYDDIPDDPREWVERMAERGLLTATLSQHGAEGDFRLFLQGEAFDRLTLEHEELWVFDHDGYFGLLEGECSLDEAREKGELLMSVVVDDREAFAAWAGENDPNEVGAFCEAYCGTWSSFLEYAENFVDDIGLFHGVSGSITAYFDYERFARDLQMDYDVYDVSDGVAVFRQ